MTIVLTTPTAEIETIKLAYDELRKQGIRAVLVGTAALKILGKLPPGYAVTDIDFLVAKAPKAEEIMYPKITKERASANGSVAVTINKVKVDYILTNWRRNTDMRPFFTRDPAYYGGVPVADIHDVIGLKIAAGRPKDFEFMVNWAKAFGTWPDRPKRGWLSRLIG